MIVMMQNSVCQIHCSLFSGRRLYSIQRGFQAYQENCECCCGFISAFILLLSNFMAWITTEFMAAFKLIIRLHGPRTDNGVYIEDNETIEWWYYWNACGDNCVKFNFPPLSLKANLTVLPHFYSVEARLKLNKSSKVILNNFEFILFHTAKLINVEW